MSGFPLRTAGLRRPGRRGPLKRGAAPGRLHQLFVYAKLTVRLFLITRGARRREADSIIDLNFLTAAIGVALLAGVGLTFLSNRLGLPALVLFLGLGMLVGSDGLGLIHFDDANLAQVIGSLALAIILFEGGIRSRWRDLKPVLAPSVTLATAGVVMTAFGMGALIWLAFDFDWTYALLIGAIIGSTDAAAVFAAIAPLPLQSHLSSTLELESGTNDPMAIFLAVTLIQMTAEGVVGWAAIGFLAGQIIIGFGAGWLTGIAGGWLLNRLRADTSYPYMIASLALALLTFGVTNVLGGSGFLAVYVAGVQLARTVSAYRLTVLRFHESLAWMFQILMFIILGLLVSPARLIAVGWQGLAIAAGLMFIVRPIVVWILTQPFDYTPKERMFIGWAGLRGAVPIILATFPLVAGVGGSDYIFDVVFFVTFLSAALQGGTLGVVSKALGLHTGAPVTASHSLELAPAGRVNADLIHFDVAVDSPLVGTSLAELPLPEGATVSALIRNSEIIPPRGSTMLQAEDDLYILVRHKHLDEVTALLETGSLPEKVEQPSI